MSKYNDFMSHIRVDDEMHRRIMNAVSEAIEQGAEVTPLNKAREENKVKTPIKRKAKVSVIRIISIAAAAVLVVGGAVMLATRTMGSTKSVNEAAMETRSMQVDSALRVDGGNSYLNGNNKYFAGKDMTKSKTATEDPAEANDEAKADEEKEDAPTVAGARVQAKRDVKDLLPFKIKTAGSGRLKDNIAMTVYTGENGEKMILLTANAGTDIAKAYYPEFKGRPALLQTEAGQVFEAIDTSAGRNEQVSNDGPFDAVTWTKNGTSYMLVFGTKTDVQVFISLMEII